MSRDPGDLAIFMATAIDDKKDPPPLSLINPCQLRQQHRKSRISHRRHRIVFARPTTLITKRPQPVGPGLKGRQKRRRGIGIKPTFLGVMVAKWNNEVKCC